MFTVSPMQQCAHLLADSSYSCLQMPTFVPVCPQTSTLRLFGGDSCDAGELSRETCRADSRGGIPHCRQTRRLVKRRKVQARSTAFTRPRSVRLIGRVTRKIARVYLAHAQRLPPRY